MNLKEYDKKYEGRLNPRNTMQCDVCNRYWNGDSETAFIISDSGDKNQEDCHHGKDKEISEEVFERHMEILKEDGLL